MTSRDELARVRRIHAQLDAHAECQREIDLKTPSSAIAEAGWAVFEGTTLRYTVEEVRAWPATKSAMMAALRLNKSASYARASYVSDPCAWGWEYTTLTGDYPDEHARGLVMYREMLAGAESAPARPANHGFSVGQQVNIDASFTTQTRGFIAELNARGARIDGMWFGWHELSATREATEPKRADLSIVSHKLTDHQVSELTAKMSANESARLRNVAALAAEFRVPLAKRKAALAAKFGPRKGIDDTGGFSSSGWEE